MYLPPRHTGGAELSGHRLGHAGRATDKDVVVAQLRNVRSETRSRQRVATELGPAADEETDLRVASLCELLKLIAEDNVCFSTRAVDKRQVTRIGRDRLEQRTQRSDADAPSDEQDLAALASARGHCAVRS